MLHCYCVDTWEFCSTAIKPEHSIVPFSAHLAVEFDLLTATEDIALFCWGWWMHCLVLAATYSLVTSKTQEASEPGKWSSFFYSSPLRSTKVTGPGSRLASEIQPWPGFHSDSNFSWCDPPTPAPALGQAWLPQQHSHSVSSLSIHGTLANGAGLTAVWGSTKAALPNATSQGGKFINSLSSPLHTSLGVLPGTSQRCMLGRAKLEEMVKGRKKQ